METQIVEVPVVKKKRWWKSKTFWLNAITGLVAAAEVAQNIPGITMPILMGVSVVGNLILRIAFTDTKITFKTQSNTPPGEPLPE